MLIVFLVLGSARYVAYRLSFRALLTAEALVADKEEFALLRRL